MAPGGPWDAESRPEGTKRSHGDPFRDNFDFVQKNCCKKDYFLQKMCCKKKKCCFFAAKKQKRWEGRSSIVNNVGETRHLNTSKTVVFS